MNIANNAFVKTLIFLDIDGVMIPFNYDSNATNGVDSSTTTVDASVQSEMHSNGTQLSLPLFKTDCASALKALVSSLGDCEIVLTTSWRYDRHSRMLAENELRRILDLPATVIVDATPLLPEYNFQDPCITRAKEIMAFINNPKRKLSLLQPVQRVLFLAIDDMDLSLNNVTAFNKKCETACKELVTLRQFMSGHFVMTDSNVGLTMNEVQKAMQLLATQL